MLNKFVKDLAKYSLSQFLPAITAFITTPILTRLFPPSEYAYWAQASSVSVFLVALAVSGFGSAVLRFYPAYKVRETLDTFFASICISSGTVISIIIGFCIVILFLAKKYIPSSLLQLLPLTILIFIAQSIFTIFISVARAQGRSGLFTSFQLLASYGGLGLGLIFVIVFNFRVNGLLWGTFLAFIFSLPFLIFLTMRGAGFHPRRFYTNDTREIWKYAWPLTLGNVAMWGLRSSDLFIIDFFRPDRDVGLYSVSYNISGKSIELLVMLFLLSVSPLIYQTWENEGREASENALTMVTRIYLLLCLPASVGLTIFASPFVAILTSPEYHEGSRIVGFIVFSSFAWGLSQIALVGMAIKKQAGRLGANQIIAVLIHIGMQLLFIPRYGYIAAAVSTLIGYTTLLVLHTLGSRPHLTWRVPLITLRNVLVATLAMGLTAWGIYSISNSGGDVSLTFLVLSIFLAIVVYAGSLWILGEFSTEEKRTILRVWHKMVKKGKNLEGNPDA